MALLHMDGFSHYTALIDGRETLNSEGSLPGIITSGGPYGEPYSDGINSGSSQIIHYFGDRTTDIPRSRLFFQFHGRVANTGTSNLGMFRMSDSLGKIYPHLTFNWINTFNLQVQRGTSTEIAISTTNNFIDDIWYYFQIEINIHDTQGEIRVLLNGSTIINSTGLDTSQGGTPGVNFFQRIGSGSNARQFDMANFIVMSTEGPRLNGFIGERRIQGFAPNSGTSDVDWVRSSAGSTNWELVIDDPIELTNYVEVTTTGNTDRYGIQNLTVKPNSIDAIAVKPYLFVQDWGPNHMPISLCQVSTDVDESVTYYPGGTGWFETQVVENDPTGSSTGAWSVDGIDSMTVGIKT